MLGFRLGEAQQISHEFGRSEQVFIFFLDARTEVGYGCQRIRIQTRVRVVNGRWGRLADLKGRMLSVLYSIGLRMADGGVRLLLESDHGCSLVEVFDGGRLKGGRGVAVRIVQIMLTRLDA